MMVRDPRIAELEADWGRITDALRTAAVRVTRRDRGKRWIVGRRDWSEGDQQVILGIFHSPLPNGFWRNPGPGSDALRVPGPHPLAAVDFDAVLEATIAILDGSCDEVLVPEWWARRLHGGDEDGPEVFVSF